MRLGFADLRKKEYPLPNVTIGDDILVFACSEPVIIQPLEIQKVRIGAALRVPKGYVLNISTRVDLYERAGELFPALIVVDHMQEGELILPVRNNGRNPLHIMGGEIIAQGYISKVESIETHGFEFSKPDLPFSKSKPQKKNPIQFEIK